MNRNVLYCQFHTPIFVSGVSLGDYINPNEKSTRFSECSLKTTELGVMVKVKPAGRPTASECFIPWSNVKAAHLAPEDSPQKPTSLKAV